METNPYNNVKKQRFQARRLPLPYRRLLFRLPWVLTLVLGLFIPRLMQGRTDAAGYYAQHIYPYIAKAVHLLTGWTNISLAELILYALILWAVLLILIRLIRVILHKLPLHRLLSAILTVTITVGMLFDIFYASWGLNYFREPLSDRLSISVEARDPDELKELALALTGRANALRAKVTEDENGVYTIDTDAVLDELPDAYAALQERVPAFSGPIVRVKKVLWSRGLSRLGISGIYIGITAEANLNVDQPALFLASDGAHELAHGLGNAPENEAELTAILACCVSGDPAIAYSGTVKALIRCMNALYNVDKDAFREVRAQYSDGLVRDILNYNAYWDGFEGTAQEIADSVNDSYLKHNEVSSGVQSYGESVDLLLAVYDTNWGRSILLGR